MSNPRRVFLQTVAGSAAGLAGAMGQSLAAALPTVRLGKHQISRLIVGENPFYGYSHFNRLLDELMREWCTSEQVCQVLSECERYGINTWEFTHSARSLADLDRHRREGGKLNFILLSSREMEDDPSLIGRLARRKPIGIVHHGGVTDRRFREGEAGKVREFVKRVRDAGVPAGISTHNPEVVDRVESENWDMDFFMTCLFRLTRTAEEVRKTTSEIPLPASEVYLEGDPARMFRAIRQSRKTCLAFKLLAAGRLANSAEQIDRAFRTAYENIKSQDAAIVGFFPKFSDQVKENTDRVRRILAS